MTDVVAVEDGRVTRSTIDPAALGFVPPAAGAIGGGDPEHNARVLRAVLAGEEGPARDVVLMNAAAALWVPGRAGGMEEALPIARASIDDGAAAGRLEAFVETTRRLAPVAA